MNLFYQPQLPDYTFLDLEESKHCVKVLRMKNGDAIDVIDGKGNLYKAIIDKADHKKCSFQVHEIIESKTSPLHRHIAIAPTKNIDRIEWFVEKAVEIGIDEISFILCEHSERKVIKLDRIIKKAISAMKQSYKYHLPQINEMISFKDFVDNKREGIKAIAYVDFSNPKQLKEILEPEGSCTILIGPEGDFSEAEVEASIKNGFLKVGLGQSRLRTETAGIVAAHLMTITTEQ